MRLLLDERLPHRLRQLLPLQLKRSIFMKHRDNLLWTFPRTTIVVLLLLFCTINTSPAQTTLPAEDIAEKALAATCVLGDAGQKRKNLGHWQRFLCPAQPDCY